MSTEPLPWGPDVEDELADLQRRIQAFASFDRLWKTVFSEDDRIALGDDMRAFDRSRSVGALMQLYSWSQRRAVIEGAKMLNLLDDSRHRYLLREIGEATTDYDIAESRAAQCYLLVLVPARRAVYWRTEELDVEWSNNLVLWNYFLTLARYSSRGERAGESDFGDCDRSRSCLSNWKLRLGRLPGFPQELHRAIQAQSRQQWLEVPAGQICILDEDQNGRQVRRVQGR